MTMQGQAHGLSLPLHYTLQKVEGARPEEALEALGIQISKLGLRSDITIIVVFGGGPKISLEPVSEFGSCVLEELRSRGEFTPCPDGECQFRGDTCMWCGTMKPSEG